MGEDDLFTFFNRPITTGAIKTADNNLSQKPARGYEEVCIPNVTTREQGKQAANKTLWPFFQITHNRSNNPRTRASP